MLSAVPDSRCALAAQAAKVSCARAGDDEIGLLRQAILEDSGAVEYEAAGVPCNVPDDPFEANERCRAVAAVHHQVFDMPITDDIAAKRFLDSGSSQLWQVLAFTIRFLVPALDGEPGVRNILHVYLQSASTIWHRTGTQRFQDSLAHPVRR